MANNEVEILLVEDNPADEELTLRALRQNCLVNRIHVARDGEEALDFLFCHGLYAGRSLLKPPGLVLLDLKLPKLDGRQVLRVLKEDRRNQGYPGGHSDFLEGGQRHLQQLSTGC